MSNETNLVVVQEEAVLEKRDLDGNLIERMTILNGEIINHEFFVEGGNSNGFN